MFIKKKCQNLFKKPVRLISVTKTVKKTTETSKEEKKEEAVVEEEAPVVECTEVVEEIPTPKKQQATKKTTPKKQEGTKEAEK